MKGCKLTTPVVLFMYKRYDHTLRVFEAIRQAQPTKLFVIADGPKPEIPEEVEKCQLTRSIIKQVDWNCTVLTNYSDTNLGCKQRVSSGLNWVFENVEDAIILEDDCLPEATFFQFCAELLNYYRDDQRVMVISGDNFQLQTSQSPYSYYFSRYPHCWGWATWKRAWKYYNDTNMKIENLIHDQKVLRMLFPDFKLREYWTDILQSNYRGSRNSWADIWCFSCWLQNALTVIPNTNLVTNIGFCRDSTHTKNNQSQLANLSVTPINFPIKHPPYVIRDVVADEQTDNRIFHQNTTYFLKSKIVKIVKKEVISKFIKYLSLFRVAQSKK